MVARCPKLTRQHPAYRLHKPSGQAVVTLGGRDFYLGPHGTQVSRAEYDRLVGEWLAHGRRLPVATATDPRPGMTVNELLLAYPMFGVTCRNPLRRKGRIID